MSLNKRSHRQRFTTTCRILSRIFSHSFLRPENENLAKSGLGGEGLGLQHPPGMASSAEEVKVLVLGSSGVGKSAAVHLICTGKPASRALPATIGCNVEIKSHDYKCGTNDQRTYFVELWEIGGGSGQTPARRVFYNSVHGVILVHDLTNSKSRDYLRTCLADAVTHGERSELDAEMLADFQMPILVVGTKALPKQERRSSTIADFYGAEQLLIDSFSETNFGLAPGSSNAVKLSHFFDKVIEKRYSSKNLHTPNNFWR